MMATSISRGVKKTVDVDLGDRAYPIYIGEGLLKNDEKNLLQKHVKGERVLIVSNTKVAPLYMDDCVACFSDKFRVDTVILPDGEEYKRMDVMMSILDKALENKHDRKTTFVALGGGVIGDMVGFAAAVYQRGVNFIQIPTTLMAMVDSAVGGKTAVNHPLGKNMIGAFYQPQCVLIDTNTLDSLPDRELKSGIAEIIKYGLIGDPDFFEWQEESMDLLVRRDPDAMATAIERSCVNKAQIVAKDEKEAGVRATLNLGHTFGHAVETNLGYGQWLHGEAVAVGMAMATDLSHQMGYIDETVVVRAKKLIERADLPLSLPKGGPMTRDNFLSTMAVDKKVEDGNLKLILLKGALGSCVITKDFSEKALIDTIDNYCKEQ